MQVLLRKERKLLEVCWAILPFNGDLLRNLFQSAKSWGWRSLLHRMQAKPQGNGL